MILSIYISCYETCTPRSRRGGENRNEVFSGKGNDAEKNKTEDELNTRVLRPG
jgi:hypothetical protein